MAIVLALLVVSIALLFLFLKYQQTYWRRRGIPHNEPHFPLGDLQPLNKTKSFNTIYTEVYDKFKGTGPFAGMYFSTTPTALILDLELIKRILIKDFSNFADRGRFFNEIDDPLTGNLFQVDGVIWRRLRHKLSSTFTSGKMKYMFPTVVKVALKFVQVFGEKHAEAPSGVMEITDLVSRFTADVIGLCAFGLECNSLRNPRADFAVIGRRALQTRRHNQFIDSLIESFPQIARKLRMRQQLQDVHDFYMGIVRDTIEYRERNNVKRDDFMNILLELKANGEKDNDNELTVEEIAAQAFVFFIAGFETSSTTMGFTLYELAKQPALQDRLRDEINEVLERHKNEYTYECMTDMKYMEMVFSETLRMYPVLPFLQRKAKENYDTGNPKYHIRKGTPIIIPTYGIQHDPQYYPDPKKFDPERFTEAEIKKRPACTWLPFGDGPRNCIGLRFGKMQALIGLSYLLKNFKFSACAETESEIDLAKKGPLLLARNGIKLRVEKV